MDFDKTGKGIAYIIHKIDQNRRANIAAHYDEKIINDIEKFCKEAKILRTPENASNYFNGKYTIPVCRNVMAYLNNTRRMGAYYFEENENPQKYMREYILRNFENINNNSKIMEVGPGDNPLFLEEDYSHWHACDINYSNGEIHFSNNEWAKGKYINIFNGGWENLSEVCKKNNIRCDFDVVCGSHSFEHSYKPITALKEAGKILKSQGILVLFVPDGNSTWEGNYDQTHAIYMVPEMVTEFFEYADCFEDITCEQFRVNMDLVITAKKKA